MTMKIMTQTSHLNKALKTSQESVTSSELEREKQRREKN